MKVEDFISGLLYWKKERLNYLMLPDFFTSEKYRFVRSIFPAVLRFAPDSVLVEESDILGFTPLFIEFFMRENNSVVREKI